MRFISSCAAAILTLSCGCSSTREILVRSDPDGAFIKINGKNVGLAPQTHRYTSGDTFLVHASKQGYFDETVQVNSRSPQVRSGLVKIVLQENPVWKETTTSRATNVWLRVQINETLSEANAWQRVVDSVTSTYDTLEQLDPTSGYIRSTIRQKSWNLGTEVFRVRTQVIGSIASSSPLIYKFKIKAESSAGGNIWQTYDRVFREDAEMIEELSNRLGIK